MKILQLCHKPPYPPIDGGSMCMHNLTTGLLNNGHEVKVIAYNSYKHPCKVSNLPKEYVEKTKFETIFINLRLNTFKALKCLLLNKSYHVQRFVNNNMKKRLESLLKSETFDIIQLEGIFMATCMDVIKKYSNSLVTLRAHNVEHLIWERIAQNTKNPIKKIYIKQLAKTLKKFELEQINNFDGVYTLTNINADYFIKNGCKAPCVCVPFGIDKPDIMDDIDIEGNSLFHIGSMDWFPNEEGLKWFIDEVWDLVHKQLPNVKAYLAGRSMPQWLLDLKKEGIIIHGEVPDAVRFMSSKEIMVVPLLSGSGIRIKIIEAMSIGKCVIATSQAAEGIMYENNINIVIANTPQEFADAIYKCITNKEFSQNIAKEAFNLIAKKYNTNNIAKQLVELYELLPERD